MQPEDRAEFDAQISALFLGFNIHDSEERRGAYWSTLQRMPLALLARSIEYALGESGPERLPTAPQLWRISRKLRAPGSPGEIPNDDDFRRASEFNLETWALLERSDPLMHKIQVADALWSRYSVEASQSSVILAEKREWLRGRVSELLGEYARAGRVESFETWRLRLTVLGVDSGFRIAAKAAA